ncbi:MAG: FAH family protein, partial [Rhizobiales bacterium]|nr:FAH family protein [Hyphomicrobiales bacterium]
MRLMQIKTEAGERAVVATVPSGAGERSYIVPGYKTVYALAKAAIAAKTGIESIVEKASVGATEEVD